MSLPCYQNRQEIARQLHGRGVEFGPGCHPLPLGPYVESIEYCDVHDRAGFARAFKEVEPRVIARFPETIHHQLDFNAVDFTERLGVGAFDFVVANHVLEHLTNPLQFLVRARKLLNEDGLLFIALPDPRCTFDRDRQRTPLRDVRRRFDQNETVLSEEKIIEWVRQVDKNLDFGPDSPAFKEVVLGNRLRSIHVNVWLMDDVIEIFQHLGRDLAAPMTLLDGMVPAEEFILLFRNTADPRAIDNYPIALQRIWTESQSAHLEASIIPRLERQTKITVDTFRAAELRAQIGLSGAARAARSSLVD